MSHVDDRARVLVVGAGLAGLRCAELLQRSGVTVELHEASERLGGRCWSAHGLADGIVAEHGGELIAPDHRHVAALAKELGLQLEDRMAATPPELRSGAIVFEGRRVGPGEGTAEMARALAVLVQEAERIADLRPGRAGEEAHRLDEQTVNQWLDENVEDGTRSLVGRAIKTAMEMAYGIPADRISGAALAFEFGMDPGSGRDPANEHDLGGDVFGSLGEAGAGSLLQRHVHGGNDLLVHGLAERLDQATIRLGSALTSLHADEDGVVGRFGDSTELRAEAAVLAIPLPALREVDLEGAHLSERRRGAIGELSSMGQNTKLLIGLDHPPSELPSWPGFVGDLDEPPIVIWDTSSGQAGPGGVLTVYTASVVFSASEAHAEPSPAVIEEALGRIERLVPGVREHFNGRAWLDSWPHDPWSHGSYLGFGPGQYTRYWGLLGEPEDRIHFAGEHTSTFGQGYLDGAIESGERAARDVLDDLGLPLQEPGNTEPEGRTA
jgi:monoamine oxidase